MRPDEYPHPVSEPAAAGVPEYADDDSTARDEVPSVREADGPAPAPLPPDREDGPLALDEFGTTAEEQRRGEPLDDRLAREEPDVAAADADDQRRRARADAAADNADVPHEWTEPDPDVAEEPPVEADPHSPVSTYERIDGVPGPVGRLVQPDEGAHEDTEPDEVAVDGGSAGGGPSAEEAAMHEITDGGGLRAD